MVIKAKRIRENANIPHYATTGAAAVDLYGCDAMDIQPGETVFIDTGVAFEIPEGFVGLVYARSGLACKKGLALANGVGVIDSDFRDSVKVALHNHSNQTRTVVAGERLAQMIVTKYPHVEFEEVDELQETERGLGGFGSSGKF